MSTYGQVNDYGVIVMKELFTVHQVSKACGISRSTILRLESKGRTFFERAFESRQILFPVKNGNRKTPFAQCAINDFIFRRMVEPYTTSFRSLQFKF